MCVYAYKEQIYRSDVFSSKCKYYMALQKQGISVSQIDNDKGERSTVTELRQPKNKILQTHIYAQRQHR